MHLYLEFDKPLTEQELENCRAFLARRSKGEPLAYIKGKMSFYHCEINVSPDVLIPRPETEILVDRVVQTLKGENLEDKTLWDLCCGSGCLGIALKKEFSELEVVLSDISPKALQIANENARQNGVEVKIVEGDLFQPFQGKKTHFLICNPPYISQKEFDSLRSGSAGLRTGDCFVGWC